MLGMPNNGTVVFFSRRQGDSFRENRPPGPLAKAFDYFHLLGESVGYFDVSILIPLGKEISRIPPLRPVERYFTLCS